MTERRRRQRGRVCPRPHHGSRVPREPSGGTGLVGAALALAACQSYEPAPLEPAVHRAAWHARTVEQASVGPFLDRMARDGRTADGTGSGFDAGDGVGLEEGQVLALVFNPGLRLQRLDAGLAAASAEYAGLWRDPQLQFSVLRITESIPDPWVITPALGFSLPVSGRLGAERSLAGARLDTAHRRVLEAEWEVWLQVRQAWIDWSAAQLRVAETERLVAAVEPLVRTATALADAGELPRTEAALFAIERAQRSNQLRRLRGETQAAEQRLRTLVGLSPEAPVTFVPSLSLATPDGDVGEVPGPVGQEGAANIAHPLGDRNPTLARLAEEYEVAEERLRLEIRKQWPDLTLGPMYEADAGRPSVGLFGTIPIPLWNANRRAIAEARARREIARAAFETRYETLVGRWAQFHAQAESLASQRADLERTVVPLVDGQLTDALRLLQLGEASSLVLLESLSRAYSTKLELIDARSGEATARAQLEFLKGPPETWQPETTPAGDEDR